MQRTYAGAMGIGLLCPTSGMAQSVSAPVVQSPQTILSLADASATHAAAKGVTFKAATSLAWAAVSFWEPPLI